MPSPTSITSVCDRVGDRLAARQRDPEVVQHVVVGLAGGRQLPVLARSQRIERQLDVVAQLLGALRPRGLVVDQLVLRLGARMQAIDAVDPAAQVVGPDAEGEGPLEPDRLGVLIVQAAVVAGQRVPGLLEQLAVDSLTSEAAATPAALEQLQQLRQRGAALGVVALEHLVDDDPEALVDRLLGRDAQDAGELVAQRAAAVGLDVGGRQRQAVAAARQERHERVLLAKADRLHAARVLRPRRESRLWSSVEVWRISRCSGVAAASRRALMSASASPRSWPSGRCISAATFSSSR